MPRRVDRTAAEPLDRLVQQRQRFLGFLRRRVASPADAEDLLQAAFVKAATRAGTLRQTDRVVEWFYRLLRNAVVDHYRARAARRRLVDRLDREMPRITQLDDALYQVACRCVGTVMSSLPPRYAELIRRVELGGEPLARVGHDLRITRTNAAVRLHRARRALAGALRATCGACARHRCRDCTCRVAGR